MARVSGKDSPLEVGDWLCMGQSSWGSLTALSQVTEVHDGLVVHRWYNCQHNEAVTGSILLLDGAFPGYMDRSACFGYDFVSPGSIEALVKYLSHSG